MPMTERRWARIKKQVALWHLLDDHDLQHLDPAAAGDMLREMRSTITEIMTAAEEPDTGRNWFMRVFGR